MPKLSGMTGVAGAGGRIVAVVRRLPYALREDLWTAPVDPLPPMGSPDHRSGGPRSGCC